MVFVDQPSGLYIQHVLQLGQAFDDELRLVSPRGSDEPSKTLELPEERSLARSPPRNTRQAELEQKRPITLPLLREVLQTSLKL